MGSGFAGSDATANPFTATFEGNGLTIDNLYINLSTTADADGRNVGLFANIGRGAAVRNLGLVSPYVKNTRTGGGNLNYNGALAGISSGAVSRVYVDGGQVDGGQAASGGALDYAGCLLGPEYRNRSGQLRHLRRHRHRRHPGAGRRLVRGQRHYRRHRRYAGQRGRRAPQLRHGSGHRRPGGRRPGRDCGRLSGQHSQRQLRHRRRLPGPPAAWASRGPADWSGA